MFGLNPAARIFAAATFRGRLGAALAASFPRGQVSVEIANEIVSGGSVRARITTVRLGFQRYLNFDVSPLHRLAIARFVSELIGIALDRDIAARLNGLVAHLCVIRRCFHVTSTQHVDQAWSANAVVRADRPPLIIRRLFNEVSH